MGRKAEADRQFGSIDTFNGVDRNLPWVELSGSQPETLRGVVVRTACDSPKLVGTEALLGQVGWSGVTVVSANPHRFVEQNQLTKRGDLVAALKVLQIPGEVDGMINGLFGADWQWQGGAGEIVTLATDLMTEVQMADSGIKQILNKPAGGKRDIFSQLCGLLVPRDFERAVMYGGLKVNLVIALAGMDLATTRGQAGRFKSRLSLRPFTAAEVALYVFGYEAVSRWNHLPENLQATYDYYRRLFGDQLSKLHLLEQGVSEPVLLRVSGAFLQEHPIIEEHIEEANGINCHDPRFEGVKAKHLRAAMGVPVETIGFIQDLVAFSQRGSLGSLTSDVARTVNLVRGQPGAEALLPQVGCWEEWRQR